MVNDYQGLDGEEGSVSLQSKGKDGCFLRGGPTTPGSTVKLSYISSSSRKGKESRFSVKASFQREKGLRGYNAISFVAKGEQRSFLLEPLMSLKDESYNVYFRLV